MSSAESPTSSAISPARALGAFPGLTLIKGRCQAVRSFNAQSGRLFAHLIVTPAPDAYSHPETVEVIARSRLAERDQEASIVCRVGGVRNNFNAKDKETGELIQVNSATVRLTAVE